MSISIDFLTSIYTLFRCNKKSICLAGISAKFPFKYTFMYLFIHFHFSSIAFAPKCILFHIIKRQFYGGHFRISVNESTFPRIVDRFGEFMSRLLG